MVQRYRATFLGIGRWPEPLTNGLVHRSLIFTEIFGLNLIVGFLAKASEL
jgi:hypothetical protein